MYKLIFSMAMSIAATGVQANCLADNPEIGDIGPGSERVCIYLEERFPLAELTVTGRYIHSPNQVSVVATVDGKPVTFDYELIGADWKIITSPALAVKTPRTDATADLMLR